MFTVALFAIAKMWEQPKCPLTDGWIKTKTKTKIDGWIKKMGYVHTINYYSASKKKGILLSATTWMGLQDIRLSDISQTEMDKYHMIHLFFYFLFFKFYLKSS